MRLEVIDVHGATRLAPRGLFEPLSAMHNRFRKINVKVEGQVVFSGAAHDVADVLKEGVYEFEWADEPYQFID